MMTACLDVVVDVDGALDVSATCVADLIDPSFHGRLVNRFDKGGPHVHGAVNRNDHVESTSTSRS